MLSHTGRFERENRRALLPTIDGISNICVVILNSAQKKIDPRDRPLGLG